MAEVQEYIMFFLIWLISTILIRAFFRNRSSPNLPPSPLALPIIGHLHLLAPIPHQALAKLSSRYGPLIHIYLGSVPCIVASSPEICRELLKTHENSFSDRPQTAATDYLTYGSQDFSFAPYGPYWKFMKKLCMSQLLGGQTLDLLQPVRRHEIKHLIEFLSVKANGGESVDIGSVLIRMTNNVISRMGFGKRLKKVRDRFDEMMEKIIDEHQNERMKLKQKSEEGEVAKDLLDILLDIAEDGSSEMKLTRENIKAFILDLFAAGTDTSAITIEWALAELINHPNILAKAAQEIDSVVGNDRLVQESDMPNLPYLQAIVKETLRLHPTGPLIVRESSKDCTISGYHIPAKTRLFLNIWAVGRDPNHWENGLEFRPERFLSEDGNGKGQLDVRGSIIISCHLGVEEEAALELHWHYLLFRQP
ncbi:UNVERIFIED_CONTAM: cytochrome [Sesamum calycinum]|uniref:Cytochrome n=1 Tax=Sesamum calycinum TaxID=2727403 RepID=A0AAW2RU55_9LAMI